MAALPNAAKIGFTGTPIMREGKKRTDAIFGPFIDKYTIRQAEHDGAVVPIFYEGRTAKVRSPEGAILTSYSRTCLSSTRLRKLRS